jgi:hypothetical protein
MAVPHGRAGRLPQMPQVPQVPQVPQLPQLPDEPTAQENPGAGVDTGWEPVLDRWPALPDDASLWAPPARAFTAARIRMLDAEQAGS